LITIDKRLSEKRNKSLSSEESRKKRKEKYKGSESFRRKPKTDRQKLMP
jgi:hypothetical protein